MPGNLRTRLIAHGFVTKDNCLDLHLIFDPATAMVAEPGIVIADDPRPVEL